MIRKTIVGCLLAALAVTAQAGVIIGDNEWRQVTDTVGLSWNDANALCDSSTGMCSGSVGAVSLTGWTWAASGEVQALFTSFSGQNVRDYSDVSDPTWAPAFFNSFNPTWVAGAVNLIHGLVRNPNASGSNQGGLLWDTPNANDIHTFVLLNPALRRADTGLWMYQPASNSVPVPDPSTLGLLGFGLLSLGLARRSSRRS